MSTAKFDTLQNAAGSKSVPVSTVVDGSAKAWVNFNGTGVVSIRAAFNVTSITDGGVGLFTINFTSAFADTNYVATGSSTSDATGTANSRIAAVSFFRTYSTTSVVLLTHSISNTDNTYADPTIANVAVFR